MILYYILLGVIQGATEFLPVSSSGHLVATQTLFAYEKTGILVDVSLHFGTLVAILVVFRQDLWNLFLDTLRGCVLFVRRSSHDHIEREAPMFYVGIAVVVGTIPAGLAGVFLEEAIKSFFTSGLPVTGTFLVLTGLILFASQYAPTGKSDRVHPVPGFLVGVAQTLALLPGVSRSGITIVAGYFLGINRDVAARFSFLLAVPAIAGAMTLESLNIFEHPSRYALSRGRVTALVFGTLTAAVVGWICLTYLLKIVKRGQLHWFAAYCIPVGLLLIAAGLI